MRGFRHAHEDRAKGNTVGHHAGDVVADVGGVEVGADEQVGAALEPRVWKQAVTDFLVECGVGVHFAFDLEIRRARADDFQGVPHLCRRGILMAAEIRMRKQGDLRFHAKQAQAQRCLQGRLGDLFGVRIELDVGIEEEEHAVVVDDAGHRRGRVHVRIQRQDVLDVAQFLVITANQAGQQGIGLAAPEHQRGNHRRARTHDRLGPVRGHATALEQAVVEHPVFLEARIALNVADLEVHAGLDAQAHALDARLDHRRATNEDRPGQAIVGNMLDCAQDRFFLAFGIDDALHVAARAVEHRFHDQAGAEDEGVEALAIGLDVGKRSRGDTGFHRRHRNGGGQLKQQTRIERLRDQVFRPERSRLPAIGAHGDVRHLAAGKVGDGLDAGDLHRLVDDRRPDIEGTAEEIRETQRVVDLVGIVRTAGGDNGIGTHRLDQLGEDFRSRVGEGKDDRLIDHALDHVLGQRARAGEADKHVGTVDDLVQRACRRVARIAALVFVEIRAPAMHHAGAVGDPDVFLRHPKMDEHVHAGNAGGTSAGVHDLDLVGLLADHRERVQERRADDDGGAMLVVMEDRDLHALAQGAFDDEAFGRLDVLEVDAAKTGFEAGDDVDQLFRVGLVDLDVEDIDAGELLEQHALAFHYRFGREWTDVAEAEHGRAIGDDRDEVAARGHFGGSVRIADDLLAGEGDAGRIGQ